MKIIKVNFLKKFNLKALFTSFLAVCLIFFGTVFTLNLVSFPVYGQALNAWNLQKDVTNNLKFYYSTGGPNALYLTTGGNVGIGTSTPGRTLEVKGSQFIRSLYPKLDGSTRSLLTLSSDDPATNLQLDFSLQGGIGGSRNSQIQSADNGYYWATLSLNPAGGNVGIGTTAPLQPLQVAGGSGPAATSGTTQTGGIAITNPTSTNTMYMGTNAASPYAGWIQVSDKNTLAVNYGLALNPNGGNVGIGTTAPVLPLEVAQTSLFPAINILKYSNGRATMGFGLNNGASSNTGFLMGRDLNNNGTNDFYMVNLATSVFPLYISSASKVGIRKTSPTADLHIKQSVDTQYAGGIMLENVAGNLAPIFLGSDQKTNIYSGSSGGFIKINTGGGVENNSSKFIKENYTPLDFDQVLKKIDQLPVMEWNFKNQNPSIRHIGPFAEDFYSIFGLNDDNSTINSPDAVGVTLAGVKALSDKSKVQQDEIESLKKENSELRVEFELLKKELESLKK